MVYNGDNSLAYILHPEGTVTRNEGSFGTTYTYNYFKKDQVGSTRVMLSAVGNTLQPQQTTDYYPFGLAHATNNLNKNKYLFSGKELQDATVGGSILGLYDFGMRQYDAIIGRWTTIDLYAGKYPAVSPYVYCLNDPINLIDLIGLEPTKDSMSDGHGGWIYYYNLDGVTVTGTTSGGDKPSPVTPTYTPTWPGSIPTGMGDDGGSGYPGPVGGGGGNGKPSNYVEKSSQNPKRSVKDKIGGKGFRVQKPFTLTDPEDIKQFIWYNSFANGLPFAENAAIRLKYGPFVVASNKDSSDGPHQIHLPLFRSPQGYAMFYYENMPYHVLDIYHSHPTYPALDGKIGISGADIDAMKKYPATNFFIINNATIYQVWKNGAYDSVGMVK